MLYYIQIGCKCDSCQSGIGRPVHVCLEEQLLVGLDSA